MVKERRPSGQDSNTDWFLPAILSHGSVGQSFRLVSKNLERKISLLRCLNTNLCAYQGKSSDSITELQRRIELLSNTLTFRLGMLSPERPGGWFRENPHQGTGPFGSPILSEPVLAAYDIKDLDLLQSRLEESFEKRTLLEIPFSENTPCLWLTLLSLNRFWQEIDQLPSPFKHLRLSRLPSELPLEFQTPSLVAFLGKVRESQEGARQSLDLCYEKMRQACLLFWQAQRACQNNRQAKRAQNTAQNTTQKKHEKAPPQGGKKPPPKTPRFGLADSRALRFMNFSTLPSSVELKKRYRAMAQKLHPDRPGGCEESFKRLTLSYAQLVKKAHPPPDKQKNPKP